MWSLLKSCLFLWVCHVWSSPLTLSLLCWSFVLGSHEGFVESSPASPRAHSGSEGEFITSLKQNCQPQFLPLDHKECRHLALLFCKVPGCVFELTYYCSWKDKQLLNVTDKPIFLVLHGFHHGPTLLMLHFWRGAKRSLLVLEWIVVLLLIIGCIMVEHLVVKVSLNY